MNRMKTDTWISILSSLVYYVSSATVPYPTTDTMVQYETTSINKTNLFHDHQHHDHTLVNFRIAEHPRMKPPLRNIETKKNPDKNEREISTLQENRLLERNKKEKPKDDQKKLHHVDQRMLEHYLKFTQCLFKSYNDDSSTSKACIKQRQAKGIRDVYYCKEQYQKSIGKIIDKCNSNDKDEGQTHEGLQKLFAVWKACTEKRQEHCTTKQKECHSSYKTKFIKPDPKKYFADCDINGDKCFLKMPKYCFKYVVAGISCYDHFPTIFGIDTGVSDRSRKQVPHRYKATSKKDCQKFKKRFIAQLQLPLNDSVENKENANERLEDDHYDEED